MKTYLLPVIVEPDEDKWSAYIPGLVEKGAATWGDTQEEAVQNIQEVTQMVIESLLEHGEPLPMEITESEKTVIAVSV